MGNMTEEECQGNEEADVGSCTPPSSTMCSRFSSPGILTNTLNLMVLTRPLMWGRTYRWLRALACVDLSLCVLTVPVCLGKGGVEPLQSYAIAHYYANCGWSLSIAAQILSFYLMGMFAFERFLAVCRHDLYPRSQTDGVFRGGVVAAAVFVLLLYVPTIAVGHVKEVSEGQWLPKDGYSQQGYKWYPAYAWLREIMSRLVPALLITFCNVRITLRLRQLRNIREGFGSGVPASRRERERRLVLLLFWVTILFYIFNTPVTVYYLGYLHTHHPCPDMPATLLTFAAISNLLQMLGNVSNFVLYFLISPEFHNTLCSLLSCQGTGGAAGLKSVNTSSTLPNVTTAITTTIIARTSEDESPNQSDSGYQQDLGDGSALPQGNTNFYVDEDEAPPDGSA